MADLDFTDATGFDGKIKIPVQVFGAAELRSLGYVVTDNIEVRIAFQAIMSPTYSKSYRQNRVRVHVASPLLQ
jgi:hypothetical protein